MLLCRIPLSLDVEDWQLARQIQRGRGLPDVLQGGPFDGLDRYHPDPECRHRFGKHGRLEPKASLADQLPVRSVLRTIATCKQKLAACEGSRPDTPTQSHYCHGLSQNVGGVPIRLQEVLGGLTGTKKNRAMTEGIVIILAAYEAEEVG